MQGLPKIGDVLDDTYRIEELIGKGGFGAVYRAMQLSMQREVAIKVLVAHALNVDEMIQRFRREVMSVRNLGHPNTIRIYDFRDQADGLLYYAMEFVRGPTLQDVIEEAGPMSPHRTAHILKQTLKSLSEAHSYGIVHRDLKPANIMLADVAGETDFVKVLDFGIAKIIDGDDDEERKQITNAGVLVGTLNYMSPEQIAGGEINPSSDLYALALIGVEMLTGRSVFAGTGQWEVLHKQISDERVEIPPGVANSALGPLLLRALEKRQPKRFPRAEDMLEALARIGPLSDQALLDSDEVPSAPMREVRVEAESEMAPTIPDYDSPVAHLKPGDDPFATSAPPAEAADEPNAPEPAEPLQAAPATSEPMRTVSNIRQTNPAIQTEPVSAPQQANRQPIVSPTGKQQTNQNLGATAFTPGENTDAGQSSESSNAGLIVIAVGAVFLVIALTVVLVMVAGGSDESEVATDPAVVAAVEDPKPPPSEETPPSIEVEPGTLDDETDSGAVEDTKVTTKQVRLLTPGVKAQVFADGKLIGETPMSMGVSKAEEYQLSAKGYEPQNVELSPSSDDVVDVKLARVEKSPPIRTTTDDTNTKVTPTATTTEASTSEKPVDDGWVDVPVKKTEKKKQEKKQETKKTEVPVF